MYDTIIIGAGPAAHMAAVYMHTSNIKQLMITQVTASTYNFKGHDKVAGVMNVESPEQLVSMMNDQVNKFSIETKVERAVEIKFSDFIVLKTDLSTYEARTVIIDDPIIYNYLFVGSDVKTLNEKGVFVCGKVDQIWDEAIVLIGSGCETFFEAKEFINN